MELKQALVWLLSGGAGIIAQKLFAKYLVWREKARKAEIPSEYKVYFVVAICGVLAVIGWLIQVAASYVPAPATVQGWIEAIFYVASSAAMAFLGTQGTYARTILRDRRLNQT